jgi:hypothetical protein
MVVSSRRECSRWHVLVVHILGWCWLPSRKVLPLVRKCPSSIPRQDLSHDSSYVLLDRLDSHHTPKMHAKISPSSLPSYYQVIDISCLIRSRHSFTKHHITDIMHSKSKAVSRMRASSLSAGVQGKRLWQSKGIQAKLPCNLSQFICIKVKH